jgi:predicted membrane protein (TIGR00267 family)
MSVTHWLGAPQNRLELIAGFIDGMLTALTLTAGKLLRHGGGLSFALAAKVGIVSACTAAFVFFVAHYAELRAELVRSERELNLLSRGRLASTHLGRQALGEASLAAVVGSLCSFLGAVIPLLFGIMLPGLPMISLGLSILVLGLLGAMLAWSTFGSPIVWAISLMAGGVAFTFVGLQLDILS